MIREELEFSISQYLDGTLSALETTALEERLATDAEARAVLAEYHELAATLKNSLPLPAVNFDRLAAHLSGVVAKEELPQKRLLITSFVSNWHRPLAIAASLLIAIGVAVKLYTPGTQTSNPAANPPANTSVAVLDVKGPQSQQAATAAIVDVTISPAPGLAENNWRVTEDVIYRPARVTWLASDFNTPQDNSDAPR